VRSPRLLAAGDVLLEKVVHVECEVWGALIEDGDHNLVSGGGVGHSVNFYGCAEEGRGVGL
jgi:hypothetical protein